MDYTFRSLTRTIPHIGKLWPLRDIYDLPDPEKEYYMISTCKSKKFTVIMKWVMLTLVHPELFDKFEEICQKYAEVINEKNELGYSALWLPFINHGFADAHRIIKVLVKNGADINLRLPSNMSIILYATICCRRENAEMYKYLLENGADPNLQNDDGYAPLMAIMELSNEGKFEKDYVLEMIKMLLQHGANPDLQNSDGTTALILCAQSINYKNADVVMKMLLEHTSNCNLQNDKGMTALMYAAEMNKVPESKDIVKLLLQKGADPNIRSYFGWTALLLAIRFGRNYHETIIPLLEHGAKVGYDTLFHLLQGAVPEELCNMLVDKILSKLEPINEKEYEDLCTVSNNGHQKTLIRLIAYVVYNDSIMPRDMFGYEKIARRHFKKKYSKAIANIDNARLALFYKDSSFGGWISVKRLEMSSRRHTIESLFQAISQSNEKNDRKYVAMFCIDKVSKLTELFQYY